MDTFVPTLLPVIFIASADKYYKLATAALHSCASVVALLKREGSASAEHASLIKSLLDAVLAKLAAADEDHDVKEAAIHACAVILAHLNHHVNNQDQSRALGLLLERRAQRNQPSLGGARLLDDRFIVESHGFVRGRHVHDARVHDVSAQVQQISTRELPHVSQRAHFVTRAPRCKIRTPSLWSRKRPHY